MDTNEKPVLFAVDLEVSKTGKQQTQEKSGHK